MSNFNARRHFAIRAAISKKASNDNAATTPPVAAKAPKPSKIAAACIEAAGFDQNERLGYAG